MDEAMREEVQGKRVVGIANGANLTQELFARLHG